MLRDRLLARLAQMGDAPDHQRLAEEVLGIKGAPPALARKLVAQALVMEDRRDVWRETGERICASAPATPGVYILKDAAGAAVYVGKAVNLRRRLRAHFAGRNWRKLPPGMAQVREVEWIEVGSELEALLREASLIAKLAPAVNVQRNEPSLDTRAIPKALVKDVLVVLRSVEEDDVELVGARPGGEWIVQRTRRSGDDLRVHSTRLVRFFSSPLRRAFEGPPLAPIVYSWLASRGADATRLDPHDTRSRRDLAERLRALFRDERLFHERIDQRRSKDG